MANEFSELPKTREDLGYKWAPISIEYALDSFRDYFVRNDARAFIMDVYASNNQVYRSILIQLPEHAGVFFPENINIGFNRDDGRQLELRRT